MVGESTKRLENLRAIESDARKESMFRLGKINIGLENTLSIPSTHGTYTAIVSNRHRAVTWTLAAKGSTDTRLCSVSYDPV